MIKSFIILSLFSLLTSCAVFKGNQVVPVTLSQIKSDTKKPSLSYFLSVYNDSGEETKANDNQLSIIEGEFINTLKESGYFSRISVNDSEADIKLDIKLTITSNPAALIPAVITGLSLYIIPSWATYKFTVDARVDNKGNYQKYQLSDSATLVQWLPMIFVLPFQNFNNITEVRKNIYNALIIKMQKDKLIPNYM